MKNACPFTVFEKKLQQENDFFAYMRFLHEAIARYVIIITVGDTGAGPLFTSQHSAAMMNSLGLKIDMQQRFRQPYIAIIDQGEILQEQCSDDLSVPLILDGNLGKHELIVYSAGFESRRLKPSGCGVIIDGVNYGAGGRGFNFFVFDFQNDRIVDVFSYDSWEQHDFIFKPYSIVDEIYKIMSKKQGTFIALQLPAFPTTCFGGRSAQEDLMKQSGFRWASMRDEKVIRQIWDNKTFHFCNDFRTLDELRNVISAPESFVDSYGAKRFREYCSPLVNTRNGIRVTHNQPKKHQKAIFLFGGCQIYSFGADDEHTIASLLQMKLNEFTKDSFIVYNYGCFCGEWQQDPKMFLSGLEQIPSLEDDVVLFAFSPLMNINSCDLSLKAMRPHEYGDIFLDVTSNGVHYTANGNRMIADGIFEYLQEHDFLSAHPYHNQISGIISTDKKDRLVDYKRKLHKIYADKICPKVGAIVMNANPFTLGHRYLVEQALKQCKYLIVFVVEEDKSEFSFADRFELVRANLADLNNVTIIPSGEFIISSTTFSDYFNKAKLQDVKVDTSRDIIMFAKEIAPCLGISVRFAGQEPFDTVTAQYNEDMSQILPQYGIEFIEIPRLQTQTGQIVSASTVRRLLEERDFETLNQFVSNKTLKYMQENLSRLEMV